MKGKILLVAAGSLFFWNCSMGTRPHTLPRPKTDDSTPSATTAKAPEEKESGQSTGIDAATYSETGVASWYGADFQGRGTSSGEVYDMFKLTAAHQTLPFNTLVEVINLENDRKVLVRINDRGPFAKGRIIDLSYKAAQELGMSEKGTATVALRIVQFAPSLIGNEAPASVIYYLQAGAFEKYENAQELLERLNSLNLGFHFSIWKEGDLYKVFSEKAAGKKTLQECQRRLAQAGIPAFIKEIH